MDQNVVGLHLANHGFTIVSFPPTPTHKSKNKTAHAGHNQRRTADGGIGSGRCHHRHPLSSFVDDVFDGGGAPLLFNGGRVAAVLLLVFIQHLRAAKRIQIPMTAMTATASTKRMMTMTTMTRRMMTMRKTTTMTTMTTPTTTMTAPAANQSPQLSAYHKEAGWQGATMMGGEGRGRGGGGGG